MYIKNRRNSNKIKAFSSYQTLCLTESLVLRNRLLCIYETLPFIVKRKYGNSPPTIKRSESRTQK